MSPIWVVLWLEAGADPAALQQLLSQLEQRKINATTALEQAERTGAAGLSVSSDQVASAIQRIVTPTKPQPATDERGGPNRSRYWLLGTAAIVVVGGFLGALLITDDSGGDSGITPTLHVDRARRPQ